MKKITNLVNTPSIALAMMGACVGVVHAATSANLLVDPGFENQAVLPTFASTITNFPINQGVWGAEAGTFSSGGLINPVDTRMLSMSNDGGLTTQTIQITSLAAYAADIAAGNATFEMSALFNPEQGVVGASAGIAVRFFTSGWSSGFGNTGSNLTLDSVPSSWEIISHSGAIPVNAAWIGTEVLFTNSTMQGENGYVDEASLTITTVPEPSTALLLGLGAFSLLHRRRK